MRHLLSRQVKKACERPPHAQWARPAGLTNRKPPQTAEAFPCNKFPREKLRLHLEEDDNEREQRKGLDKRKTKNQKDKDSRTSARVTCQRLGSRSRRPTLAKTAKTGGKSHTQTGSQRNPLTSRGTTVSLRKSRRCNQHRGQRHKQILQLLHRVTPASVRYAASGWLMLTVLAPSRYAALLRTARGGPNAAKTQNW
jgi:hypothetical protein